MRSSDILLMELWT